MRGDSKAFRLDGIEQTRDLSHLERELQAREDGPVLCQDSVVHEERYLSRLRPAATPRRLLLLAILAAAVFSHFLLDVPMHTADMPLGPGPGSPKIGLGLWNHRAASIAAELLVLAVGGLIYLRGTRPRGRRGVIATTVFGVVLVAATVATPFMPDPPSGPAFAVQALIFYAVLALGAGHVDRRREPRV